MIPKKLEYLGDGAYASVEGDMIRLYCDRGGVEHYVYLEHETWKALEKFAKEVWP